MIEKLLEDWLDNSTERTFQYTFAYLLSIRNNTILHISRHCGMEMGKDIIALTPNGVPTAYQLKTSSTGRFTLSQWRDINAQIRDLVYLKISHPSIGDYTGNHISYLVTNGVLEEEVNRAISDFNQTLIQDGRPVLQTIVKGEILDWAKEIYPNIIVSELKNTKLLLELFFENGRAPLPKEKFTNFIENTIGLDNSEEIAENKFLRQLSSTALICSIAMTSFSKENNWIALIESWLIYLTSVYALTVKYKFNYDKIEPTVNLVKEIIYSLFINLLEELKTKTSFIENDKIFDRLVLEVRIVYLVALMSVLGLWRKIIHEYNDDIDDYIFKFIDENKEKMDLLGEAAIPQYLALYWYIRNVDATFTSEKILGSIINDIIKINNPRSRNLIGLPPPYYQTSDVLLHIMEIKRLEKYDDFKSQSYFLKGLMYMLVRTNFKQTLKLIWPDITRLTFMEFRPKEKWQYFMWRNKEGAMCQEIPKRTKEWEKLKEEAYTINNDRIPDLIRNEVILLLLFIIVYPHRANSEILKLLDEKLWIR